MTTPNKNLKICEQERKPKNGFLTLLSAPARRALENNGIVSLQKLSTYSEREILKFHVTVLVLYLNLENAFKMMIQIQEK